MYLKRLEEFNLTTLPDLDEVVLGALTFFKSAKLPEVDFAQFKRPLVVGSGNAAVVGRLLFDDVDAVFADESSYTEKLTHIPALDGAVLISASGSKHAVGIAKTLKERGLRTLLLTNNKNAPAREIVGDDSTFVFPKVR